MINYCISSAAKENQSIIVKAYTKLIGSQKTSFKSPMQFHLIHNPDPTFLIDHTHYELMSFNALKRLKLIDFVQSIISKNLIFLTILIAMTKQELKSFRIKYPDSFITSKTYPDNSNRILQHRRIFHKEDDIDRDSSEFQSEMKFYDSIYTLQ